MSKVILICGLPGSGKTHLGKRLAEETGFDFIDDVSPTHMNQLKEILESGRNCIISDPNFVLEHTRKLALGYLTRFSKTEVEWIFFENNPSQCMKNVVKRNDGRMVVGFIDTCSKQYKIPDGAKIVKVYSNANT